jgi:hypothetical protein
MTLSHALKKPMGLQHLLTSLLDMVLSNMRQGKERSGQRLKISQICMGFQGGEAN